MNDSTQGQPLYSWEAATYAPRMTLTDFLLARIAEDEAIVSSARQGMSPMFLGSAARVLADCDAKRRIVALGDEGLRRHQRSRDASALGAALMHQDALLALAAVYADHPDYDEAWAL